MQLSSVCDIQCKPECTSIENIGYEMADLQSSQNVSYFNKILKLWFENAICAVPHLALHTCWNKISSILARCHVFVNCYPSYTTANEVFAR